ncbi:transcription factor bHLH100-like [Macadamia integrifolia]|uniref:transcription factor bHLH100-like n=1 Tax=Macadamia integrifolia TaxID=60698 RepID=UPI001C52FE70|nr:transcription factor bHLH100-like [Macadamia integrifolia]
MLANSTPFPSFGGLPRLDDPTVHKHKINVINEPFMSCNYKDTGTSESFLCFPSSQLLIDHDGPTSTLSGDPEAFKKLNHNASERDRRKRLNGLYFTLQSLLPEGDRTKKLSIPATVSCALKYIPELQKHVQKLTHRKEDILSSIYKQGDTIKLHKQEKGTGGDWGSLPSVSASKVDEREVVIQICASKAKNIPLSKVLVDLEEVGLQVLSASAIESNGEKVFYNLHLQVKETQRLESEVLSQKLMLMYQNREELPSSYLNTKADPEL